MPDDAGEAGTHIAACIRVKSSFLLGIERVGRLMKGEDRVFVLHVRKSSSPNAVMRKWIRTWLSWTAIAHS